MKILVLSDNFDKASNLKGVYGKKAEEIIIEICQKVEEAVEKIEKHNPGTIICDPEASFFGELVIRTG